MGAFFVSFGINGAGIISSLESFAVDSITVVMLVSLPFIDLAPFISKVIS